MDRNRYLVTEADKELPTRRLGQPSATAEVKPPAPPRFVALYVLTLLSWALVGGIVYAVLVVVGGSD